MKRFALAVIVAALLAAPAAHAVVADVRWSLPTSCTDNSVISPADQAKIVTTIYLGDSATGPWSAVGTSLAGATSLITGQLSLVRGSTYWFTSDETLYGKTSAKAAPLSVVYDYGTPNPGTMLQIILKN